jgi:hypothetical protein
MFKAQFQILIASEQAKNAATLVSAERLHSMRVYYVNAPVLWLAFFEI